MKKIKFFLVALLSVIGIIIGLKYLHNKFFYYKNVDFSSEKYQHLSLRTGSYAKYRKDAFNVCELDKEVLFDRTWYREELIEFNRSTIDKKITHPMEAINLAQLFANEYTNGCHREQPFFIQYIREYNTWVVIGDIVKRTWYKDIYHDITKTNYSIVGGELCLVIDAETGNIVFMDHTT